MVAAAYAMADEHARRTTVRHSVDTLA